MAVEKLLSRLSRALDSSNVETGGGVVYIALDRERQVLSEVGFRGLLNLMRQMRKALDEVSGAEVEIFRFGLSAFVVQVPSVDSDRLQQQAQMFLDTLNKHSFRVSSRRLAVTVSMSVCRFDKRFVDADEMLLSLMERTESLFEDGGNALSFVEPEVSMGQAQSSNQHMLGLLTDALGHDKLKVVFQSLFAIEEDESEKAFEMFPRLKASDGHLITAAEFIPLARESSLLPALDRWMLNHAIRLITGTFRNQSIRLFINQSDSLLLDEGRRGWFKELLEKTPALERRIVVELSMDDVMMHLDGAMETIKMAHDGQIGICLSRVDEHSRWDLFGGELKCDYLRISPDFVSKLVRYRDLEQRFVRLSGPVREMGTRIIMPMIENSQTAASMWRAGADYMQGNMIEAPEDMIRLQG